MKCSDKPVYCARHIGGHSLCKHPNCKKRASYGVFGTRNRKYCAAHKPDNFVNVNIKLCRVLGCKTVPNYGAPGTKTAHYCVVHKPDDFVNIRNKTCEYPGCKTQPVFGIPGTKTRRYCLMHKPANYINVKNWNSKNDNTNNEGEEIAAVAILMLAANT